MAPPDVLAIWVLFGLALVVYRTGKRERPPAVKKGAPFVRQRVALDPKLVARAISPPASSTSVHEQLRRAAGGRR